MKMECSWYITKLCSWNLRALHTVSSSLSLKPAPLANQHICVAAGIQNSGKAFFEVFNDFNLK